MPTLLKEILETRIMIKSSMKKVLFPNFSIIILLQFTKYFTIDNWVSSSWLMSHMDILQQVRFELIKVFLEGCLVQKLQTQLYP